MSFTPRIIQNAWVVPDLETAARHWNALTGVGPFLVNRDIRVADPKHRGKTQVTRFSTAIAQHGDMQIELVQQLEEGPSAYRDTVPAGKVGFHHIAFIADDFDADVAHYTARGHEIASSGVFGPMRFVYIDAVDTLGHMIEIVEDKPAIRAFFGAIRKAADTWDGDPATLLREVG